MNIPSGIIFGYLGPNGAGKTTTIRCLLGILKPTNGLIKIFGEHIKNWSHEIVLKENIGFLPGDFTFYLDFTVKELLDYFSELRKRPPVLRDSLVKFFELDESKKVEQLSKGYKQKLGLIQALMHDPDLLILDEPTVSLDPLMQQRLYKILDDFRNRGKTIFFSSHNLDEVQKICDEVAVIKDGQLVSHDKIAELYLKINRKIELTLAKPLQKENLMHIPFISAYQEIFSPDVDPQTHRYVVWLREKTLDFSQLFSLFSENVVKDVKITEPKLEDYFMHYYQEQK